MTPNHPHAAHRGAQHDHHQERGAGSQVEILDLEAEILAEHLSAITGWLPVNSAPRQIVDLGCGTGTGTFALLDRFPDAHVTAVDTSMEHLQRLREHACSRNVEQRVRTVLADLDDSGWPDLGSPELVWASASMHHLANPERALRNVHQMLTPGGLFAVTELADFPRFLPDDAPSDRPGLEQRCHAATDRHHAEHLPHRGADWGPMLAAAGFTVEGERGITVNVPGSRREAVRRYALASLRRARGAVAEVLCAEDLAALDRLLDSDGPESIAHRDDLTVRTERTVWTARRT